MWAFWFMECIYSSSPFSFTSSLPCSPCFQSSYNLLTFAPPLISQFHNSSSLQIDTFFLPPWQSFQSSLLYHYSKSMSIIFISQHSASGNKNKASRSHLSHLSSHSFLSFMGRTGCVLSIKTLNVRVKYRRCSSWPPGCT